MNPPDHDNAGYIDYDKFLRIAEMPALQMLRALQTINRPRSLLQVEASNELYFGEQLRGEAERSVGILSIEQSRKFLLRSFFSQKNSLLTGPPHFHQ